MSNITDEAKGSLLLAWQVRDKHCLVIGGGEVAYSRIEHLIRAGAKITVITGVSEKGIHNDIMKKHNEGKLFQLLTKNYEVSDLTMYQDNDDANLLPKERSFTNVEMSKLDDMIKNKTFAVVCCCIDDYDLSTQIYYQCKALRIPVNIADKPPLCDFYFGSMLNKGSLQIMISTNGKSPRLSRMVKDKIKNEFLNVDLDKAASNLGAIRQKLREEVVIDNDLVSIDTRMNWIKNLTDLYNIEQWGMLDLCGTDNTHRVKKIVAFFPDLPPSDFEKFKSLVLND